MISQLCAFAFLANPVACQPVEDQSFFAILAETKVGRMAGMPPMDFSRLPPGIKLPPQAMMFSGQPTRLLNIRLWSPTIAPADATASVAPPAGLKQGNKLDLQLYRPEGEGAGVGGGPSDPTSNPEFTIKIYWGSSETVKEGQPRIIKFGGLSPEQQRTMAASARQSSGGGGASYFYKAGWTTGYWPTPSQPGSIDPDASLVGKYSLSTSYTGNVDIEAPSNVNFLAPIEMSTPDLTKKIDLKKSIVFNWAQIPNALGQYATIMGMEGKNTLILWSSSEVYVDRLMGDMGFLQMSDVKDFVSQSVFMPGDRTTVSVPAGIFGDADFATMMMAGYGPGTALDKAQPLPRIQTKTSLMLMLGGKKANRNGFGG